VGLLAVAQPVQAPWARRPRTGDSVWLSAQFAASAVKITDGGVPICSGGSIGSADAG
jgi:hypothetical protein